MKLAIIMIVVAYAYLVLKAEHVIPRDVNACLYFAAAMAVLTTINLVKEWKEYHREH